MISHLIRACRRQEKNHGCLKQFLSAYFNVDMIIDQSWGQNCVGGRGPLALSLHILNVFDHEGLIIYGHYSINCNEKLKSLYELYKSVPFQN